MLDHPLNREQQVADLSHAPAAAPASASIVPDRPLKAAETKVGRVLAGNDTPESPPPSERPEIAPDPAPETDPALQPEIPPVENPSI